MKSLLSQFAQSGSKPAETPEGSPAQKSGLTRSEAAQARYEKEFGAGNTVAKASAGMGLTHVGCLNQVYRYEKKGLIARLAERDQTTGGLIFKWNSTGEENAVDIS